MNFDKKLKKEKEIIGQPINNLFYKRNIINDNYSDGVEVRRSEAIISVDTLLLRKRIIFFNKDVNSQTSAWLIKYLLYLESKNPNKPILLYLNCPGGSVYSGLAILDIMDKIKCEIQTVVTGLVASFGSMILLNGTKGKRYATKSSRIMIHQPLLTLSEGTTFQQTDLEIQHKELKFLKEELIKRIAEKTNQTFDKVLNDCERDNFMSPEEALKYGIIDKII